MNKKKLKEYLQEVYYRSNHPDHNLVDEGYMQLSSILFNKINNGDFD